MQLLDHNSLTVHRLKVKCQCQKISDAQVRFYRFYDPIVYYAVWGADFIDKESLLSTEKPRKIDFTSKEMQLSTIQYSKALLLFLQLELVKNELPTVNNVFSKFCIYRGSPTYTKITNTVSTTTFFFAYVRASGGFLR